MMYKVTECYGDILNEIYLESDKERCELKNWVENRPVYKHEYKWGNDWYFLTNGASIRIEDMKYEVDTSSL